MFDLIVADGSRGPYELGFGRRRPTFLRGVQGPTGLLDRHASVGFGVCVSPLGAGTDPLTFL